MRNRSINLHTFNQICLMLFLICCLVSVVGTIGCSDSGGGNSKTVYHLTGYDGVEMDSAGNQLAVVSGSGNASLNFYAEVPWFVNQTFQVSDADGWGISSFTTNDFTLMEDGVEVPKISSEMNIRQRASLPPGYTYTLKTVLFLDNSPSLAVDLDKIIEAAFVVIDNLDEERQQKIAIVAYDEAGDFTIIQGFTNQAGLLNQALIERVKPSYGTTNFYGAMIDALALWDDNPSSFMDEDNPPSVLPFEQGILVAITDGNDTSNLNDVNDAIAARKDKQIITVGVGDVSDSTADDLSRLGNAGYYPVPKPNIDPDENEGKKPADENLFYLFSTKIWSKYVD